MATLVLFTVLAVAVASVGIVGPCILAPARGLFEARPRLGIIMWSTLLITWIIAVLSLGPILAWNLSGHFLPGKVGVVCRACVNGANPLAAWTTPIDVFPPFFALVVPLVIGAWCAIAIATASFSAWRTAQRHVNVLRAAGLRNDLGPGVWVIPDTRIRVYSTPARGGATVLSSGALSLLDEPMLKAVLAHEAAHLTHHHHRLNTLLRVLLSLAGWVPLVRSGAEEIYALIEMEADDHARALVGDAPLCAALMQLIGEPRTVASPSKSCLPWRRPVLAAVNTAVAPRVRRLLNSDSHAGKNAGAAAPGLAQASNPTQTPDPIQPSSPVRALSLALTVVSLQALIFVLATVPYVHIILAGCLRV